MKSTKRTSKSDPLAPRKLDWSKAVRGKHFAPYNEGTNLVAIDSDLLATYPDSASVNEALRALRDLNQRLSARASKAA